jgi:hypothetical protein
MGLLTTLRKDRLSRAMDRGGFANALRPAGALFESGMGRSIGRWENGIQPATGTLYLFAVEIEAGLTITSLSFNSATTALSVGSNQWFALYDSSLNKLAVTSDDTSTAWAANSRKTLNLSAPFTTTYSGLYYVGICIVATTTPTLVCQGASLSAIATLLYQTITPALYGSSTGSLTNPASAPATASAITASQLFPYFYGS